MRYATSLCDVVVVRPLLLGSLRLRPHCACFRPRDCAQSWTIGTDDSQIRAVQARRLAPPEAVQFVTMRLRQQLRNQVRIVE